MPQNCGDLRGAYFGIERDKDIRPAQVPVIFWDFVFQNEAVPEGIPCKVRDGLEVLEPVIAVMTEDQFRFKTALQSLDSLFD